MGADAAVGAVEVQGASGVKEVGGGMRHGEVAWVKVASSYVGGGMAGGAPSVHAEGVVSSSISFGCGWVMFSPAWSPSKSCRIH